jgi:hypothetical protein
MNRLHVDLQPAAATFAFNADFFITALEGQVQANIDKTSGVKFAATLTPVNILGMVQIKYVPLSFLIILYVYLCMLTHAVPFMASGMGRLSF